MKILFHQLAAVVIGLFLLTTSASAVDYTILHNFTQGTGGINSNYDGFAPYGSPVISNGWVVHWRRCIWLQLFIGLCQSPQYADKSRLQRIR
jgi:hypothetical protein